MRCCTLHQSPWSTQILTFTGNPAIQRLPSINFSSNCPRVRFLDRALRSRNQLAGPHERRHRVHANIRDIGRLVKRISDPTQADMMRIMRRDMESTRILGVCYAARFSSCRRRIPESDQCRLISIDCTGPDCSWRLISGYAAPEMDHSRNQGEFLGGMEINAPLSFTSLAPIRKARSASATHTVR
jgi:hypothetical protein